MYTHSQEERERLYRTMSVLLLPEIRHAIEETAREFVYDLEGFHPDAAYEDSLHAAADEITARLAEYFAGLTFESEAGLFEVFNSRDMHDFLDKLHTY